MTKLIITTDMSHQELLALREQIDRALGVLSPFAQVDEVWWRVNSETRRFLMACARAQTIHADAEFTLEDVNHHLGWEPKLVRQRMMSLGRTERAVGTSLFSRRTDYKVFYRMEPDVAGHILSQDAP